RTGVCAGPKPMVEEFFSITLDGVVPDGIAGVEPPAEVKELLAQLPAAIDYGLYGLQTWGVTHAVWLAMRRADQALAPAFDGAGAAVRAAARRSPAGTARPDARRSRHLRAAADQPALRPAGPPQLLPGRLRALAPRAALAGRAAEARRRARRRPRAAGASRRRR